MESVNVSGKDSLDITLARINDRFPGGAGLKAVTLGNDLSQEALGCPIPGAHYLIFMEVKG